MTSGQLHLQAAPYARAMSEVGHDPEAVGRIAERMVSEVDPEALGPVAAEASRLFVEFTLGREFVEFVDEASSLQEDLRAGLHSAATYDTTREESR